MISLQCSGRSVERLLRIATALVLLLAVLPVRAAEVRWITTGTTTNDWSNTNNWSTTNVPAAGDDVIINYTNVNVFLTNTTAELASLLMSNSCTLIFSNWDTALTASNVSIWNNAKLTCIGFFKNNAMSNRVYVVCSNFTLQSGGSIDVIGRGYTNANGPGTPSADDNESAGSYGGWGGGYYARAPYGSAEAPLFPGSGANPNSGSGGNGGGAVRIDATGTVTISGAIYANGADGVGNYNAGGSGGGVYITCNTMAGTGGIVRANGGSHGGNSGAGGGGRIAVVYNTAAQSNESPSITFSVLPGSTASYLGDIGTLYFPDNQLLGTVVRHSGKWMVPSLTNWAVPALTISNASIAFPRDGFFLSVGGDLTLTGASAKLFLGSNDFRNGAAEEPYYVNMTSTGLTLLQVGGNLIITNSAQLYVYSGNTNSSRNYGALIDVTGDVFVANGSELYLYSQQVDTNSGASPRITARNVTVASGGTIYARGQGHRARIGPGKDNANSGGAGHGGQGGNSGGPTYGSSNAPMWPGSGGGAAGGNYLYTGSGGSMVRIEARESVRVDGTINAAGARPISANLGGGSGGGIFIMCRQFEGGGTLSAAGGPYYATTGGGGGGGRIAIWFDVRSVDTMWQKLTANSNYFPKQVASLPQFTGTVSVAGGAGDSASNYGTNGTIMFIQAPAPGTIFSMH